MPFGATALDFVPPGGRALAIRPGVRYNREKCVKECLK